MGRIILTCINEEVSPIKEVNYFHNFLFFQQILLLILANQDIGQGKESKCRSLD